MLCRVCGDELTGLQRQACSRSCRIKLDGIKRRESGRLRKANMTPEQYARKRAQNKADADKRRAEGRHRTRWACVTCTKNFEVKRYSQAGYWCSKTCRADWLRLPVDTPIIWHCNTCAVCHSSFITPYIPHKFCSPPCKYKAKPTGKWITPHTRMALYHRDGWTCHLCNKPVPQDINYSHDSYNPLYPSLDHVVPRSHGGTDDPSNLRLAHTLCNSQRRDSPIFLAS
jgi:transposase-like protein